MWIFFSDPFLKKNIVRGKEDEYIGDLIQESGLTSAMGWGRVGEDWGSGSRFPEIGVWYHYRAA